MNDQHVLVLDLKWVCKNTLGETIMSYDGAEKCRKLFECTPLYKTHDYRIYQLCDDLENRTATDLFVLVKGKIVCYHAKAINYSQALNVSKLISCEIRRLEPVNSFF